MAKKRKYYVVWEGNNPGVYDNWTDCQLQVKGYPNAKYQSFTDLASAEEAYQSGYMIPRVKSARPSQRIDLQDADIVWESISVDAACSGNPGDLEYRGVETRNGNEIFHVGPLAQGTNNIGEFLALVHGLALLKKEGKPDLPIYSDSKIAIGWIKKGQARTKIEDHCCQSKTFRNDPAC